MDYRDNRQRWAESHQVVHFYAGQWCTFTPALTVFPSPTSASGHLRETKHLYGRISEAGGAKFWFQGMRNCYLAVAERELLLPSSLTSRLLNRAPIGGIAAGHPKDWTLEQLREPAQRVADRIDDWSAPLDPDR